MTAKVLSIDLLTIDAGTQCRVAISEEVVSDYAELIEASEDWPLGPIDVFHDGTDYLVADGFHRTLAAERVGRASIPCRIHKGTATDARIFGMTANDRHGLRMSRADKRFCVVWLLEHGGKMTQREVAEKAGVSASLVKSIVAERNAESVRGKVPDETPSNGSTRVNLTLTPQAEGGDSVADTAPQAPAAPAPRTPAEDLAHMRKIAVQHLEAAQRAADDMEQIQQSADHGTVIGAIQRALQLVRKWK